MTGLVILLLLIVAGALAVTVFLLGWIYTLVSVNTTLVKRAADHRKCVDALAFQTGNEFAGLVLDQTAAKWGQVETLKHLDRLRRQWKPGDEGVAGHWMREQANAWRERDRG